MLTGTGDLGRRLAKQRERCGLSRAETADRADIAVSYLEYLETSAIADPGPDVLIRLADALGTTAAALSGGGLGPPPGQRRAAGHPVLAEFTPAGCRGLLAPGVRIIAKDFRPPVLTWGNSRPHGCCQWQVRLDC